MSLPIVLRPDAEDDLLEARDWYERRQAGLGDAFAEAVEVFFARIEAMPELYAVEFKGVRRGKLRRFPYVVYYRLREEKIEVIAVLHGARKSPTGKRRL